MNQIIKSILDNDLYKFSMQCAVMLLFPKSKVRYKLIVRTKVEFPEGFAEELREQINSMRNLKLGEEEKAFFSSKCKYMNPMYFDFLEGYRYNPSEVGIIQNGGDLQINIEGYWYRTILWEVPLMALISELYFKMTFHSVYDETTRHDHNQKKAALFNYSNAKVADFGTRRRYSFEIQKEMVEDLSSRMTKGLFVGTSNVFLAFKYNLTPIGTEAHEWFMFHAAKYGFQMANELGLKHWSDVYQGDLGTALPDTFTTDSFLKSFGKKYSKLYDGVRQDSGVEIEIAQKFIDHYNKLNINPLSKTIVFSNALTPEKAIEINKWCNGQIGCSFGIGTNLSNDLGAVPLNMVIKMSAAKPEPEDDWIPTIKLSDDAGKHTGDEKMIEVCKYQLHIK